VKIADSAMMRPAIATFPRDGRFRLSAAFGNGAVVALIRFHLYS
jgi:hypothetical protein